MKPALRPLLALALLAASASHAQVPARPADADAAVQVAIHELSDGDLKAFYVRCSRAAMQQRLGGEEIALCSVGYELLLTRTFRRDFHALLAWSRTQPDDVAVDRCSGEHDAPPCGRP